MSYTILFDFLGTLIDSRSVADALFEQTDKIAASGYPSLPDILAHTEGKKLSQAKALKRIQQAIKKNPAAFKPLAPLRQILAILNRAGVEMAVVSTRLPTQAQQALSSSNMNYFSFVDGGSSLLGKPQVLGRLIRKHSLNPKELFLVADEAKDIEAAKQNHIKTIAVTWGFSSKDELEHARPDYIISDPNDLLTVITEQMI